MPRVMVVDDDPEMRHMVANYLEQNNLRTAGASRREDIVRLLATGPFDLILLDMRLGHEDGLDVLRELRARSEVPVIITSGHRREEIDRVVGLELGADDYVTKPFSLRELLARIRVVLRRAEASGSDPARRADKSEGRVRFGPWVLDRRLRELSDGEGTAVPLTKGEYNLLLAFLDAPQRPLSREYLLQATRVHEDVYDRSIDVQILRLRRKLERDPAAPTVIRTQRGIGYVFTLPVQPA